MSLSRRHFIARGSILGAGLVIHGGFAGLPVLAQPQPPAPPRRRSLLGMATNDPTLVAWREGVKLMQALPAANTFNWTTLSTIHGTTAGFNKCPHGNWYFLPWHRAYITMYERKVRELTGFAGFALPYWDWTLQPTFPPAFSARTFQSKPNALFVPGRTITGAIPTNITGSAVITQVLAQTPYEKFGTSRPQGQNSTAVSWVTNRGGVQGLLESTPHNLVHNRIGGFMPSTQSPLDPIFMMHHGNIDRLWAVWNASGFSNSNDPLWTGMTFTANYFNNDGSVWSPKVSDLQQPEALGYTYGLQQDAALPMSAQAGRIERLFALTAGGTVQGANVYRAASSATGSATQALAVTVQIDPAPLKALMGRGALSAGEEMLGVQRQRAADAAIPRVVGVLRNITLTRDLTTEVRVFLNATAAAPTVATTDPSYVGTFGFFGGDHAGHDEKPSVALDLTEALGRLLSSGASLPDKLTVQLLPVPIGQAAATAVGTVAIEAVELAVVSP